MDSKVIRIDSETLEMLQVIASDLKLTFTTPNKVIKLVLEAYIDNVTKS